MQNERPTNFLCNGTNEPTTTSPTTPPSGRDIFLGLYADGQVGVCVNTHSSSLGTQCFRYNNWIVEKKHFSDVTSKLGASCTASDNQITCTSGVYICYARSNGEVYCRSRSSSLVNARIYSSGKYTRGVSCS